jgi:hypothetical protein
MPNSRLCQPEIHFLSRVAAEKTHDIILPEMSLPKKKKKRKHPFFGFYVHNNLNKLKLKAKNSPENGNDLKNALVQNWQRPLALGAARSSITVAVI